MVLKTWSSKRMWWWRGWRQRAVLKIVYNLATCVGVGGAALRTKENKNGVTVTRWGQLGFFCEREADDEYGRKGGGVEL
jgi:hypothetical protein